MLCPKSCVPFRYSCLKGGQPNSKGNTQGCGFKVSTSQCWYKRETSKKALHNCLYECEDGGQLEPCWEKRPHIRRAFCYSPDHRESLSDSICKISHVNFGIQSRNRYQGLLLKRTEIQGHLSYLLFGHKLLKLLLIKSTFLISKTSLVLSYREEPWPHGYTTCLRL